MNSVTDTSETTSFEAALAEFDANNDDGASEITDLALEDATEDELKTVAQTIESEKTYESQPASAPIATLKKAVTTVTGKKHKTKTAKTGRITHSLNDIPPIYFVLDKDPKNLSETDLETNKKAVIGLKPLQVKIAEKFENLFTSLAADREPSRYTKMAFSYLYDKGEATSADLVKMYQASGLGEGTARSQCGQIMNLLSTVKIANRSGQKLTLLPTNTITKRLHKLIVDAASAVTASTTKAA